MAETPEPTLVGIPVDLAKLYPGGYPNRPSFRQTACDECEGPIWVGPRQWQQHQERRWRIICLSLRRQALSGVPDERQGPGRLSGYLQLPSAIRYGLRPDVMAPIPALSSFLPRRGYTTQPRVAQRTLGPASCPTASTLKGLYNPFRVDAVGKTCPRGGAARPGLCCVTPSG